MNRYWETPLHALRLAEGRLNMLMDADLPSSDHPGATAYVLEKVRAAIADRPTLQGGSTMMLSEQMSALRDARTTLAKTATARIGSDELTIPRQFFDSALRNIDKVIAALASGMEARRAAAENTDAVHDSPAPQGDAQQTPPSVETS